MIIESIISRCLQENISLSLNNDGGIDIHAENDIPDDLLVLLKENKAGLIHFIRESAHKPDNTAFANNHFTIMPARRAQGEWSAPLSYSQQRLWLIDQIENGSSQYNLSTALLLQGALDVPALESALQAILERHEILRTVYQADADGQVMQVVKTAALFKLAAIDLSLHDVIQKEDSISQFIREEASATFDLGNDIMLRGALVKKADDCHVLILTMHHIAVDGWSRYILCEEIFALYGAFKHKERIELAPLSIQYSDYALWQKDPQQEDQRNASLQYWQQRLANAPAVLNLPTDFPRPDKLSYSGGVVKKILSRESTAALNKFGLENGCTLFMVLHAALSCLLGRYANQTDIVIGTPVANRDHPQLAPLVGFFVNSLVLRSDLSGNPTVNDLLQQHKLTLLDAFEYQQTPFEYLVQALDVARNLNKSPLFQVMLALQNNSEAIPQLDGIAISTIDMPHTTAKFDLTLDIIEQKDGLHLTWEYATDLFNRSSIEIMANDYETLLDAMVGNPQQSIDSLPISPMNMANKYVELTTTEFDEPLRYWEKQLAGSPVVHGLPLDYSRSTFTSSSIGTVNSRFDSHIVVELNQLHAAHNGSLLASLHAAVSVLLSRYSNERDIVVGIPLSRDDIPFTDRRVLRSDLSNKPSFNQLINRSHQLIVDGENQHVPFARLVEHLKPELDANHHPLFQILLVLENDNSKAEQLPCLLLPEQNVDFFAPYDLSIHVHQHENTISLRWLFNQGLFKQSTIEHMAIHFNTLLARLIHEPDNNVFSAGILSEQESYQLQHTWNDTATDYPTDYGIHQLFEAQVKSNPNAIAVVYEQAQLSYAELNQRANQLAHYLLKEKNITPNTLVGVCVERSLDMLVAMLGILKAGGAYVPLDPEYPQARLAYMLEDAGLTTVVTQSYLLERTPGSPQQAICLDDAAIQQKLQVQPAGNPERQDHRLAATHLAYVIYTSGSTGNPKGVMIEHTCVVNFLYGMSVRPGITQHDCLLAVTSTSFDIHGLELFLPLMVGAKIVVASRSATYDPLQLMELVSTHAISMMQATPATWKMLVDAQWQPVQPVKILCGGEALSQSLAAALLSHSAIELWNMYGPTETTIWSCVEPIKNPAEKILMGRPIINTNVYVVDDEMNPVPVGVAGELLIGGAGVARGYLHRPELTAEKFIQNPFVKPAPHQTASRLYRTGDLVRWLPDGNLEFLGRIDHQVKVRGFRIELGEIENILLSYEKIKDSVVLAKDTLQGEKYLVAYVVVKDDSGQHAIPAQQQILIDELRQHLSSQLPDYMVPGVFIFLPELPLTPNGKIDRKALPEPKTLARVYIAPRSDMEQQFCTIWEQVLSVKDVGITDNFFQLGGHSMLAAVAITKMRAVANRELPLRLLFEAPTIESITDSIVGIANVAALQSDATSESAQSQRWENLDTHLSLLRSQNPSTKNVLFVPGAGNAFEAYESLARKLIQQDVNVFSLHHDGVDTGNPPPSDILEIVDVYFPQIMKHCPAGLVIAGYCIGGVIGYELSARLYLEGMSPAGLFLIDTTFMALDGVSYQAKTEVELSFEESFLYGFFISICATYSKEPTPVLLRDFLGMSDIECLERSLFAMQLSSADEKESWSKIIWDRYVGEKAYAFAAHNYVPNQNFSAQHNLNHTNSICPLIVLRSSEVRSIEEKIYADSAEDVQRKLLAKWGLNQVSFKDLEGNHIQALSENEEFLVKIINHHIEYEARVFS